MCYPMLRPAYNFTELGALFLKGLTQSKLLKSADLWKIDEIETRENIS